MNRQRLRTQLSVGFVLMALVIIALVSLGANILINRQFEKYVASQQKQFSDDLAANLAYQYDIEKDTWNVDYIHGVGMYALNDGYIVKLSDAEGKSVWDAENHDMEQCQEMMADISARMSQARPGIKGDFVKHTYPLKRNGKTIGSVEISYYSPYYLNDNEFQFIDSLNMILLVVGIVSILGAAVVALFFARRLATPITNTIEAAHAISEGDYSIRVNEKTQTEELAKLEVSINQMARALESQEALRKQLTTDVAHELRTPLTNVATHLEMMIDDIWEPSQERLQSTYDEVGRITKLVDDLTRLSQAENDHLALERSTFDMTELTRAVAADFSPLFAERSLTYTVEGEPATISGDRNRLQQVLINLMSNALKYTEPGGSVAIRTTLTKESCITTVSDTGIGIPADELPLIFERFYRTDKSRDRATGGTGIGLTIASSIIKAHGGTLTAHSAPGEGTTFTITLPRA